MTFSSKPIQELLHTGGNQLSKLVSKAQAFDALNEAVAAALDKELIPYCRVGCYESGVLTLFAMNAGIATRLRYNTSDLLSQLRALPAWAGLCSIQIKVQKIWPSELTVSPLPLESEKSPPLSLSNENAKQIQSLIDSLKEKPGMEKMIESLQRILKHQR